MSIHMRDKSSGYGSIDFYGMAVGNSGQVFSHMVDMPLNMPASHIGVLGFHSSF